MEENLPVYYVTLKPTRPDGKQAEGAHHIAYVDEPAVEELGIYLQKQDNRIVADEEVQKSILKYLREVGRELPSHWKEVSEEEYLSAKKIELSNNPEDSESFNDLTKGDGTGQWLVRYKYTGPQDSKNRSFCSEILRMDRIYTEEEIKNGLSNPQFGNYSIWDYKGSYGCRHIWKRQIYFEDYEDKEVRKVGFVPKVTARLDDTEATTLNAFLSKDEKMQVVAPLLIPDKDIYRSDELGEYNMRFSAETINEIREVALQNNLFERKDIYKNTHRGEVAPAHTIDQWLIKNEQDKAYTEYGFDPVRLPIGTWMVKSQITDKNFWEREIKMEGKHAYSIEAFINMSVIELQNQKQINMEESQIVLPDGEHLIDGKVYIVKDGAVVEVKEITEDQEEVIEDVAEKAAEEMESKEEEPKEEMAESPKEETPKEEAPKEEMEEEATKMEEKPSEEKVDPTARIEALEKQVEGLMEMIAEKEADKVVDEEPKDVEMKRNVPFWKKVSNGLDAYKSSKN